MDVFSKVLNEYFFSPIFLASADSHQESLRVHISLQDSQQGQQQMNRKKQMENKRSARRAI